METKRNQELIDRQFALTSQIEDNLPAKRGKNTAEERPFIRKK
ncbi:hypothetical protein [Methylomonas koyamae]|nr:hypothetical protein [Methylomonas koyamae]